MAQKVKDCYGCDYLGRVREVTTYKPAGYHRIGVVHYYAWCDKNMCRVCKCKKCHNLTINGEKVEEDKGVKRK